MSCRVVLTHPPIERWTADGTALIQLRGTIVDAACTHPSAVVRFAGKQQAELLRWGAVGKHLAVEGHLEIKAWLNHMALLINADNIFPLNPNPSERDLRRIGIYAGDRTAEDARGVVRAPRGGSKAARADVLRKALDEA